LQSLSNGCEILLALAEEKRIAVFEGAALSERNNIVVGGLRAGQVAGCERLPELLLIGSPGLKVLVQLLVERAIGNG
jgi:hypothetical protein